MTTKRGITRRQAVAGTAGLTGAVLAGAGPARAQGAQPGITATEIKLGQTMPYSGPVSAFGQIGKAFNLYMNTVNDQGGVRGRRIKVISLDDGYLPAKTVEQTRRLVEQEGVAAIVASLGTSTQLAVQPYLNAKKVPQVFSITGNAQMNNPAKFPWTMGLTPSSEMEARMTARYVRSAHPESKVGILYQNDLLGREYLTGFKDGLGDRVGQMVVAETAYDLTDPVVDSQIVTLRASGADVLFLGATSKVTSQAIRKARDLGWNPLIIVTSPSSSVTQVFKPIGLEKAVGVIAAAVYKDPSSPNWFDDPGYKDWLAWMKKYNPAGDITDYYNVYGYSIAQLAVEVLQRCGNDLSRDNIMKTARNLDGIKLPMMMPGIEVRTSPNEAKPPVKQVRLQRFDGQAWVMFGDILSD